MSRVLVVEDDPALARALGITLRSQQHDVRTVTTGTEAVETAVAWSPELVVLDLGLPDMDGTDVLRALRAWSQVPVVVLSARQTSDDKVDALDAGADDYVTKPFGMDELLARLRAAVRRGSPGQDAPVVVTASFTVDLARRLVTDADGLPVSLTPTEYRVLELLARDVGRVVGRRELLQELRGPHLDRETHYLRVYLNQLRAKLEPEPSRPRHLITEAGVGYRLVP
ncbi:response regulator [Aquipuribacter hungaricus]|uniref:Response regulator n=1 Tax=Aquipuribacter hungaricus TaxID=545624 RepID=A0ABV7WII6_9MICO